MSKKPFVSPFRIRTIAVAISAASLLLLGGPIAASAQIRSTITSDQLKKLGNGENIDVRKNAVRFTVQTVSVDSVAHTATIQLADTTADPTTVTLDVKYVVPQPRLGGTGGLAQGLVASDSTATDSAARDSLRTDSLEKLWSLVSWITDLPHTVKLKPHETKSITLHLQVPTHLKPGTYSAHVLAYASYVVHTQPIPVQTSGGQTIMMSIGNGWQIAPRREYQPPAVCTLIYKQRAG